MRKILIIDNTFDPPHGCPEIRELLEKAAHGVGLLEVSSVRAPEGGIPRDLRGIDGVVLSGSKTRINESSPWIEAEMDAIRDLYRRKVPTLGICYGEQLIARALGGETGPAAQYEYGWVEVELQAPSTLFEGLPEKFYSFEYHADEVRGLPFGCRRTARSKDCPVQAYDVEGVPMWGVQFHPERGVQHGWKSLQKVMARNEKVINGDHGPRLFDPAIGETIFRNFLKRVWVPA